MADPEPPRSTERILARDAGCAGEALPRLGADTEVGAIVITGAGRGFCAGGDVKTMANRAAQSFEERVEGLRRMHQLPLLLRTLPKIVIAMVNGPAAGAGLGLAMACDLRVAARSARLRQALPESAIPAISAARGA